MTKVKVTKELGEFLDNYRAICLDSNWENTLLDDFLVAQSDNLKLEYPNHPLNVIDDVKELRNILSNGWYVDDNEWTIDNLPRKFKFKFGNEEFLAVRDNVGNTDVLLVSWETNGERSMISHILKDKIQAITSGCWEVVEILN